MSLPTLGSRQEGIRFRPFREGDEEAVNEGFNRAFHIARSLDEWRWKFPERPEGRWMYLALAGGEVIAQYAAVPARAQLGGERPRIGQVVDAFCRRRHGLGRRGIFNRTVETFFHEMGGPQGLSLLFGFPSERHLRLGLVSLGYGQPDPVELWERQDPPPAESPPWPPYRVRRGFDATAADRLWRRSRLRYPYAVIRDSAWLARRYCGHPRLDYVHLTAWRWGRPHAWAALSLEGGVARWLDLVWDGHDPRALAALDEAACAWSKEVGARRWEMWLRGDPEAEGVMSGRGFLRRPHPQGLQLTVRSFHPRIDVEAVTRRLYFTLGDSDLA